jgi:hypothetical protein
VPRRPTLLASESICWQNSGLSEYQATIRVVLPTDDSGPGTSASRMRLPKDVLRPGYRKVRSVWTASSQ